MAASQYARHEGHDSDPPPPVTARFFYSSPLAIDDPLSPLPPLANANAPSKLPPRPFSDYDNTALDDAWHELRKKIWKYSEENREKSRPINPPTSSKAIKTSREKGRQASDSGVFSFDSRRDSTAGSFGSRSERRSISLQTGRGKLKAGSFDERRAAQSNPGQGSLSTSIKSLDTPVFAPEPDIATTTGTPFIRAPSRKTLPTISSLQQAESKVRPHAQPLDSYEWDDGSALMDHALDATVPESESSGPTAKTAVGVSRLHTVVMPELNMEPIYWAPVNDVAPVIRGTWFYKETMLPVEVPVANMLEAGYTELRVWTDTWQDELRSAVQVGAAGEEKIVHRLWPELNKRQPESRPSTSRGEVTAVIESNLNNISTETPEQQRERIVETACDILDVVAGLGDTDNKAAGTISYGRSGPARTYASAGVIYANAKEAHILKPNLQPSVYYGRRPLANYIQKGRKLGVPVVRGFDQAAWDKLYPPKKSRNAAKAYEGVSSAQSGAAVNDRRKSDAELAQARRPNVTDLVLVIHGIGQKLSERMESYHFTHAMNGFRREINVELGTDSVKVQLRKDAGGVMVLPVNWRHSLSFEDGGYRDETLNTNSNHFSLKDITPDTLPSVRNIVSDVMLDIPYYLSHHQPKMIAAVIREANRIYKLWCENNSGFSDTGRVHVLAHSLGSVMAIDILSNQPTTIPPHLEDPTQVDLPVEKLSHFLFNTTNLFLAGSPAGFFLLLKRSSLMPRLHRAKPDKDDSADTPVVCGEQGTYGCLAVDNIYNIINPYDPVSYRLNAAVDATYAHSLRTAWIPSATPGWFGGNSSNDNNTGWFSRSREGNSVLPTTHLPTSTPSLAQLPRLPSNVELETHNFSREEIAEKRMYLLNDNGQIDYYLRYGGGPLEIQYLTMLGAHSSYWLLKDFVRMLVGEIGRRPGREGKRAGMGAVKRKAGI